MKSLRMQLLKWLLPLYCVAALCAMVTTYLVFGWTANMFMDNQLRLFVDSHLGQAAQSGSIPSLTAHAVREEGALVLQVWGRDGRLLATSWPQLALPRQQTSGFRDITIGADRWRVYAAQSAEHAVQSAQCLAFRHMVITKQALQAGLPIALLIPLSAVLLWFAIRMALRRLESVAMAAAAQNEHNFGELPIQHVPTEIRPLVLAINRLLSRLSEAFGAQRRFVQDAAHELRTPITALSLQLENLKARVSDEATCKQVAQFEAGLGRIKRMVEQLLRLARQEAPRSSVLATDIELSELLKDTIGEVMPLADRRRIDVGFAAAVTATVQANRDELRSLFHNLIDNALRYAPEGGMVDVRVGNDSGTLIVEVMDNGPGIPTQLLPRVFDRFFRIEGSGGEGSGLGLAIARNAAERNRIELQLSNRADGRGLIARVRFQTRLSPA